MERWKVLVCTALDHDQEGSRGVNVEELLNRKVALPSYHCFYMQFLFAQLRLGYGSVLVVLKWNFLGEEESYAQAQL